MRVFWQSEPLDEEQKKLLAVCQRAHAATANRQSASSGALVNAANASRNYQQSIAAALMTLGEVHAPVPKAMQLLNACDPAATVKALLHAGYKIPGWGNAFHKGDIDPEWKHVADLLYLYRPSLALPIKRLTELLHDEFKLLIYPNAACYTAAVAIAIGLPAEASLYLVLAGRLSVWSAIFLSTINDQPSS